MAMKYKRNHSRYYHEEPIMYSDNSLANYCSGIMNNSSADGMCFETALPVESGKTVYIKLRNIFLLLSIDEPPHCLISAYIEI